MLVLTLVAVPGTVEAQRPDAAQQMQMQRMQEQAQRFQEAMQQMQRIQERAQAMER